MVRVTLTTSLLWFVVHILGFEMDYLCSKLTTLPLAVPDKWLVLTKILMVHVTWPRPFHTRCLLVVRQKYLTADCRRNSRRAYWSFYHRWTSDTISSLERSSVSTKQTIDRLDCETSWIRRRIRNTKLWRSFVLYQRHNTSPEYQITS